MKAQDGSVIRSNAWAGPDAGRHTWTWDGIATVDGVPTPAPNGRYSLTLHVKDRAGNHAAVSYPVRLDRTLG